MDTTQAARLGVGAGRYGINFRETGYDTTGARVTDELGFKNVQATYGGEFGYTLTMSDFYTDAGLNMLRTKQGDDTTWRTDLLLTVGYYLNDNWSLFAGFRRGWQGDGVFKQDKFEEIGPYVGFGFGGIGLGNWGLLNTSFAYNFDRVKRLFASVPDTDRNKSFNYPGLSLKLGLNFKGTPHSLQLRVQRFGNSSSVGVIDDATGTPAGRIDFNLTETWAVLSYVFTLAW
jgi:hypothetical protein